MQPYPLVSVIIPAYNAAEFISDTITSVINQTWKNLEIIIINDGSTDNTETIVQNFLVDKRIKLINQQNQGCSASKNVGLFLAQGKFIQYLDADDILSKNKIENQINILKDSDEEIAICQTLIFHNYPGDTNENISKELLHNTKQSFEFILNLYGINGKDGMIQPNAFLCSRKLLDAAGIWDTTISPSPDEDGEYFCRVMLQAKAIHITEGLNYYRKKDSDKNSLSNQNGYVYVKGLLTSLILKTTHLINVENSSRVKTLMAKHFSSFIYSNYTSHPDLSQLAEEYIYNMGVLKIPIAGGANFKILAGLIGFKPALKIKKYLSLAVLRIKK